MFFFINYLSKIINLNEILTNPNKLYLVSYISQKPFLPVHPCDKADKAGCEQTCNKKGVEAQCACEEGFLLKEDGKTCKESMLNNNVGMS